MIRLVGLLCLFLATGSASAEVRGRVMYAGETPLASTCTVSVVAPMTLRIAPCVFTTTGEARVRAYRPEHHQALLDEGKAERLPHDPTRVRLWKLGKDGQPVERSQALTLPAAVDMVATPGATHRIVLTRRGDTVRLDALLQRRPTRGAYPAFPPGHAPVQILAFDFAVPAGTTDLHTVPVEVFTVLPGFPPGTGPADWRMQTGEDPR